MEKLSQNVIKLDPLINKFNATCKILIKNEIKGLGFFCNININHNITNKEMIVLFTNNHILKKEDLELNSEFEIEYLKTRETKENQFITKEKIIIKINEKRLVFINSSLDYVCIEIFDEDILNNINFFEIDDEINTNNPFHEYTNQNCFITQIAKGVFDIDKGQIIDINSKNKILYKILIKHVSSGSPIILSKNSKIIGIDCGRIKENNFKKGIFIKPILKDIQYKYNKLFKFREQIKFKNRLIDAYNKNQFMLNKLNWYKITK